MKTCPQCGYTPVRSRKQQNLYWTYIEAIFSHAPEALTSEYTSKEQIHELIKSCFCLDERPDLLEEEVVIINGAAIKAKRAFSTSVDTCDPDTFGAYMDYVKRWCEKVIGAPPDALLDI